MPPIAHILAQGAYLRAVAHGARALAERQLGIGDALEHAPGPWARATVTAPSTQLVEAYLRHLGVDDGRYGANLPAHLFPQYSYALIASALVRAPYALHKSLVARIRVAQRAPISMGQPLLLAARLESITPRGCCAILSTRVTIGDALDAAIDLSVPDVGSARDDEPVVVPEDAIELGAWSLDAASGRAFAMLTGDVNPIHWWPAYARAFGFGGAIAHAFALFAQTMEMLATSTFEADPSRIAVLDLRFTAPVVLPSRVVLRRSADRVYASAQGSACLAGTFAPAT